MHPSSRFRVVLAWSVWLVVLSTPLLARVLVFDLRVPNGLSFSEAKAINDLGEIAGNIGQSEGIVQQAARWRGGRWIGLSSLPGHTFTNAEDINIHGVVVGTSRSTVLDTRAVVWRGRQAINLGTLPGGTYSDASAINDHGDVAGTALTAEGNPVLVLWSGGTIQNLGPLPDGASGFVTGMNNNRQIVGFSNKTSRAFIWHDGVFDDLPPLSGSASLAYAINDKGWVVGYSETADHEAHATLWRKRVPTDLGTVGGALSIAQSINERGQVVGWGYGENFEIRAWLWEQGQIHNLGTLPGGTTSIAFDINRFGVIVGLSDLADEPIHGTVWFRTPVLHR